MSTSTVHKNHNLNVVILVIPLNRACEGYKSPSVIALVFQTQTDGLQLYTDVIGFDFGKKNYKRQLCEPTSMPAYAAGIGPTPAPGMTYAPGNFPTWVPGMVSTPAAGMTYAPSGTLIINRYKFAVFRR